MSTTPTASDPIDQLIREGAKLPSFPDVLLKLDEELRSEDTDFGRIAKLVGMDPVLSGQILRVANSAWYSRGGSRVNDLPRALIRLGLPSTRQLVHALVLPSLFGSKAGAIDIKAYWRHSFAVALFAQGIGRKLGLNRTELDTLWTAGLLHDIGALLFDLLSRDALRNLMRMGEQEALPGEPELEPIDFPALEREWLGTDHANLGSIFLEKHWKLPREIVWCVRYSEEPGWALDEPDAVKTILPIHVADRLCQERGATWLPPRARKVTHVDEAWKRMGISEADIVLLGAEVDRSLEQSEMLLSG
jgi:HD-like signal output (HDOD) protein